MEKNIFCHIIGLNKEEKNKIDKLINNNYEMIDLDEINTHIISDTDINKLYKKYASYKKNKNDMYKDINTQMINYWKKTLENIISNSITTKKKYVLVGSNYNFNNINKRVDIDAILKVNIIPSKSSIRNIIKNNLDNYRSEIIKGLYPVNNIDFNYIYNFRNKVFSMYKKNNYAEMTFDNLEELVKLNQNISNNKNIYVCLKDDYNISSKIYPSDILNNNKVLHGYNNVLLSILENINLNKDDIKNILETKNINILQKNMKGGKLDINRIIYKVCPITFLKYKHNNNIIHISFNPTQILEKHEINIKNYLKDLL